MIKEEAGVGRFEASGGGAQFVMFMKVQYVATLKSSSAFPLINLKGDFFKELPYTQGPVLGHGMSGDVILITRSDRPSEKRVLKRMAFKCRASERATKMLFMYELDTFYRTDHRGLAKCVLAARCPDYLAIVMKFYPLGDLDRSLFLLPAGSRHWVAARVSEAVEYLHMKRIVHSDIKLANILLDAGFTPVLGDFGLSRYLTEDVLTVAANKFGGTREYWAPEIRSRDASQQVDPFKVDVYALGVVILSLATQVKPHVDLDYQECAKTSEHVTSHLRPILEATLEPDFKKRCTSDEVLKFYEDIVDKTCPECEVAPED
ncbi:hypothetical protein EGW08_010021 [Elysia chlorotica]|uniref:Protein kinase domain-containing protein n=1 Tax=Elysia chlorotica TaxID=188477 RepID=A0A3S0ZNU1_ELYCH|nr:hypothetical protein EGW08_010021 [Elysia chlorotica]